MMIKYPYETVLQINGEKLTLETLQHVETS